MIYYPSILLDRNPVIIFIHGWSGSNESNSLYIQNMLKKGYICVNFDLLGHGLDKNDIKVQTRQNFLGQIIYVYDNILSNKNVDVEKISVFGSSFGAYLAILLSAKRKVFRLALRVPANYPDVGFDNVAQMSLSGNNKEIIEWRNMVLDKEDNLALESLSLFHGDILIVESQNDDLVPHQTIENYIKSINNKEKLTYIIMKDAPHSLKDSNYKNEFTKILFDWF